MIKKCLAYFFLASCLEATTFTVGFANFDSSTINTSSLSNNGSYFDLVATGVTNVGPIVFGTFTYNNINPVNPPLTTNLLASFVFNGSKIVPQSVYGFNGSLSNFSLGQSQTQINLAFQETLNAQTYLRQTSSALSNGAVLNSVVSIQQNPQGTFSQINLSNPSSDNLVYSYLINTQQAGSYIMLNLGTKKSFSLNPWNVGNYYANPGTLYSINTSKGVVNIWNQNFYNQPGIAYSTFYNKQASLAKNLTDLQTTGIDFIISNQPSNYVFFSEETYTGPKLNAVYIPFTGNVEKFSQNTQNYNYSPYQGAGLTNDSLGNFYILFNGTSQAYLTLFNPNTKKFSTTLQAPQAMYSFTEVFQGASYQNGLVLTSLNSPSGPTYGYNACFFNPSNQSFSQSYLISNYTATAGTTVSGTIIYTSTPQTDFVIDNSNNIIFVFNALTNTGLYQLFSNVYSSSTQNLLGMNLISQSPNPMSPPLVLSNGTYTYLVWSQYNGSYYQIFNSTFSNSSQTFGTPSTLNFNFSTSPQILENTQDPLGFIFAGSN